MRTIVLGRKEFQICNATLKFADLITAKMEAMEPMRLDANGKVNIGDAIHLVLLAVYENEDKAFRVGQELIKCDGEYITLDQIQKAIETISKAICDVEEKIKTFAKVICG